MKYRAAPHFRLRYSQDNIVRLQSLFFIATLFAAEAFAQPKPAGQVLFEAKCGSCHTQEGLGARGLSQLQAMPTEALFDSMLKGAMVAQATGMTSREKMLQRAECLPLR